MLKEGVKDMEEKLVSMLAELCDDESVKTERDMDLFEEELLDSLAFAELLYSIEEQFGVIIAPSEIQRSDINTANKIIALVKTRI